MFSKKQGIKYCKDELSLVENFDIANNSKERFEWHHKLEIELGVSRKWLIENDLYYNRPASELILLTKSEHNRLHHTGFGPMSGKHHSNTTRSKMIASAKRGKAHWCYGKHHPTYIFIPKEELLDLRYRKNYTLKKLAEHFGVSVSCVHGHLKDCS